MHPVFKITANNIDITQIVTDRVLSITVTDEAGVDSDTLSVVLDDRDNHIKLPTQGAEIAIELGIGDRKVDKGLYIVDEVILSGQPDELELRCKAADMRASLKERKTRSFDNVTLGDLLRSIASQHGLQAAISEQFTQIQLTHIDQTNEHDLHLVTRLAKQYDAVGKIASGRLIFTTKGEANSASGQPLPITRLTKQDVSEYTVTMADRGKYKSAKAFWHDHTTAQRQIVTIGGGEPALTLRHIYDGEQAAQRAAKAKLDAMTRGLATGSLSIPGTHKALSILAESKIELVGFRTGVNGEWIVTRSEVNLSSAGLIVNVEFESPKK
ncbi:hypothetical protein N473_06820 [Pseudoalteromonas luteoviolacea CPMOR-1]|uniref:Late control protein D n=1 Tax=Pseudoalteromonas luteoviolacea CPMOR-1 TaxID=1365248 RepID=A0A167H3I8_9GAMM|nr:contractile injection system protein, VgrG/Pvc8 family [Pseudoalteromonas luteoviolacea]KZN57593.1 hypothetical protein N473_06820 [Pseudoalteromonas luteoviolacea CPMOR-1]